MVTIDDGDDVRSIVTPELRLRFRRQGDRWTHAIDIRPGPWQALTEAVEWESAAEDPTRVVSPVYQELFFQQDGEAVTALLVGQAGPHHFSASVRVTHRVFDQSGLPRDYGMEYSQSWVEFDVADRCRAEVWGVEANYLVRKPPVVSDLDDSRDIEAAERFDPAWRDHLGWEANTEDNYGVSVQGLDHPEFPTEVALLGRIPSGGWQVRVASRVVIPRGTNRIRYSWSHTRMRDRESVEYRERWVSS